MSQKVGWADLTTLGDDQAPINNAIKALDALIDTFEKFKSTVLSSNGKLADEMSEVVQVAMALNKSMSTLNGGLAQNEAAIMAAAKASAELVRQEQALKSAEDQNAKTLQSVNTQIDSLTEAKKKLSQANAGEEGSFRDLKLRYDEAVKSLEKMGPATDQAVKQSAINDVKELGNQYRIAKAGIDEAKKGVQAAAGSYNELSKRVAEAKRELKQMEGGIGETSQEFRNLKKFIKEGGDQLKEFDKELGDSQRNVGNYPLKLQSIGDVAKTAFPKAAESIEGLGTKLGATGVIAGGVAAGVLALGKALYEEGKRVQKNLETVNSLTGLTGLELDRLTAKVGATAKVFDKEFNETLKASNVIIQSFGVSGEEAVDVINQALLRGVDINGDFLEQISEYSTFIATAGGDTQDLVDILLASEQAGVFSDKGLDTIKEATLRIRELTPATKDAIKGIGLSVDEIEKGLKDGTMSTLDVIKKVTVQMNKLPPISKEVGTAIADIFGGPGEDAGQFLFTLGKINETQGDWTETLTGSYKAQYELLKATEEYEMALISTSGNFNAFEIQFDTFITNVKTTAIQVLAQLANAFTDLDERIGEFKKSIANVQEEQTLINEIKRLKQELEDGPSAAQSFGNALLAMGNGFKYANLQAQQMSETAIKLKLAEDALVALQAKKNEEQKKDLTLKLAEDNKKAIDAAKKLRDAEFALWKFRMEQAIKAQELIGNNEAIAGDIRLDAIKKANDLRNTLFKGQAAHELQQEGLLESEKQLILERARASKLENERKTNEQVNAIRIKEIDNLKDVQNRILQDEDRSYEDRINALFEFSTLSEESLDKQYQNKLISQEQYNKALEDNEKATTKALVDLQLARNQKLGELANLKQGTKNDENLIALNEQYQKGLISAKNYEKERAKISFEGEREILFNTLDSLEEELKIRQKAGQDVTAVSKSIADVRLQLSQMTTDKMLENEVSYAEALQELQTATFDFAQALVEAGVQKNIEALETELTALQESTDRRLKIVGDDKQAQALIEQDFANKQKAIQDQINAQKRKAAIFDKARSAVEIIISTARAVVQTLPNIPLSVIVGAVGALNLAKVLATPIPAFFRGTDYAPGGLSLVGDRGREIGIDPSGKKTLYEKPTYVNLEKGTKIIPNYKTEDILKRKDKDYLFDTTLTNMNDSNSLIANERLHSVDSHGIISAISNSQSAMVSAIEAIPESHWDDIGYRRYNRKRNGRVLRLDNRYKLQ